MYSFDPGSARELEYRVGPTSGVPFFTDAEGRYASFRGVNFQARTKLWPYLPVDIPRNATDFDAHFRAQLNELLPEFDRIRDLGWNVIRLLVLWKGLEPEPSENPDILSPDGEVYLRRLLEFIREFHQRGVFVFLDFHQDIAHEVYNGDGFPDWALAIDPDHRRPTDADFRHRTWAADYTGAPWPATRNTKEVRHTLQSFWANLLRNDELSAEEQARARQPQTHLAKTIGATARWLQANAGQALDAIIGYQLFNEPHQVGIDKQLFERSFLPNYYKSATREIRRSAGGLPGDDRAFVLIQPRVDWDMLKPTAGDAPNPLNPVGDFTLDPTTHLATDELEREKTVFTYHHYDPWTTFYHLSPFNSGDRMQNKQKEWPALYDKLRSAAVERGMIPFITEFGANCAWDKHYTSLRPRLYKHMQTRAYIDLQMQQAERQVLNWTYWHYNAYNTEDGLDGWNIEDFSLLGPGREPRNLDLVCRPYPLRSSAEPIRIYFDAGSKVSVMHFRGAPVDAPTIVYVPRDLHYTEDFDVLISSRAAEWDESRQLLYWWPDAAAREHVLMLSPGRAITALPDFGWDLIRLAPYRMRCPAGTLARNVAIQGIVPNPRGRDIEGERVVIVNPTVTDVDVTGWTLEDRAGHRYTFPQYTLYAGTSVTIWTKDGSNGDGDLFMRRRAPIWNNEGDAALLTDAEGTEVAWFEY